MTRLSAFLRRYGLILLWLAFAPVVAFAARNPGLVRFPEAVPYPWRGALITWGILGIETAALTWLVQSNRRLPLAFALALLLAAASLATTATDMPGYWYVPARYHVVLAVSLGVAWTALAMTRRPHRSDPGPTAV